MTTKEKKEGIYFFSSIFESLIVCSPLFYIIHIHWNKSLWLISILYIWYIADLTYKNKMYELDLMEEKQNE